ncbi:hypothetical protein AB6A40_002514 [Gnathostoma spinigerum]|uniref:Secreted protein n=1 Tax=Gnathostoma spinigerum TaxID=75299 RepID=A0ABD6E7Z3_9BILA
MLDPMFAWTTPCVALFIAVSSACFLNSCPYRRYGRRSTCLACGSDMKGYCMWKGICCDRNGCSEDSMCRRESSCPSLKCRIGSEWAVCINRSMCCSATRCRRSVQCLLSAGSHGFLISRDQ